jgi:hypothetical protein
LSKANGDFLVEGFWDLLSKAKVDFLVDWPHELHTCTCNRSIFRPFIDLRITRPT